MTIALAKDVEDFLAEQVRSGNCSDASELINDIVRSLRDQQTPPFEVNSKLESWLLEAAENPTSPLTSKDFDSIRERAKNRLKSKTS
jgi:Arc/MetJ-type ribon-helix-helix transcriptional regulator